AGLSFSKTLSTAMDELVRVTATLGGRGAAGDVLGMLGHSADFMELASTVVIGWAWLELAVRAGGRADDFSSGLVQAAKYWLLTEVPRTTHLAHLCESNESSFIELKDTQLDG
ncbi:MAG: acyl-CoA dehydrogenase, partial [Archangiaceae bacterium]|nr:acyl-CoA dehydrogenase [Archangiaceae bacterium]